jgi:hypothetical protein
MEVRDQFLRPAALSPGESFRCPFCKRVCGPHRQSGHYKDEKNLLSLLEIEPRYLGRPARSLVAIPAELGEDNVKMDLGEKQRVRPLPQHQTESQ